MPDAKMPRQQERIIDVLRANPRATNEQIGTLLDKSTKTIENQLGAIYKRLKLTGDHRRIALIKLIK